VIGDLHNSWESKNPNAKAPESQEICGFLPKIGVPKNGWFRMENLIKMYDLGVPLFFETPMSFKKRPYLPGSLWLIIP